MIIENASENDALADSSKFPKLSVYIDPGNAPDERIAQILSDLSLLYELEGGSGIEFKFEEIFDYERRLA